MDSETRVKKGALDVSIAFPADRSFDVIALGRACIDLNAVDYNRPLEETRTFAKYVGGSPANIAIGTARLGLRVGFIGKVSNDGMGKFVVSYLNQVGVDTSHLVFDQEGHKIGLAFTEIKSPTECSILLYRDEVADLYIKPEEMDENYIASSKVLLISGTALAKSPSREAAFRAVELARRNQVAVVFELDYRAYSWRSPYETEVYYRLLARLSDIVIGTREEFDILEGRPGSDEATVKALFEFLPKLVVVKRGVQGSAAYHRDGRVYSAPAFHTQVLKTFGAGDAYASGLLYALLQGEDVETALTMGSAAAALVVSRHSSSEAMPTKDEIDHFLQEYSERSRG
ncbi:5-dehydro-2-deoxygluconokinase [Alicyclobacillus mali]|uniref:5-dehydro-2-deoxygluconokinase n=1 Tax=Alicyclobacillus mali (ex Roth et al. 2021) TaxID=1123961 RepID=A0ABS0F0L8_9BACL|nr:5-dehydro-2-deoxygluconokinase [Alicyclobacillus mali (ex Roth et al. 2021)]MBF8376844.1 5-dehydro-2-deoxygluconokinase [Alicyclobacillus mali (ex Roth et al. 2021)]